MKEKVLKNVSASVLQKLLNQAKKEQRSYQQVLQHYLIERFLYRLSQSAYREQFILKGALLLRTWQGELARPTKDIDLLGKVDNSLTNLAAIVRECVGQEVNDGVEFDGNSVKASEIVKDAKYLGVRITVLAVIGSARLSLQVDCGFGDVIVPKANWLDYPEILNFGQPRLLGYSIESVIAEKFHAMVDLDLSNSRMKDFYDIWLLCSNNSFKGEQLGKAIQATFANRQTPLPITEPLALTKLFWDDENKKKQWKAFLDRSKLKERELELAVVISEIKRFLLPLTISQAEGKEFNLVWVFPQGWE